MYWLPMGIMSGFRKPKRPILGSDLAGNGSMLLLQSVDKNGVLSKFLSDHDDGSIIGVSIEVSNLNKARSWEESHSEHKLEQGKGFYGRSILIPPDLTHGIWMELFQR